MSKAKPYAPKKARIKIELKYKPLPTFSEKQLSLMERLQSNKTKICFISGPAGSTKAQPLSARILTPVGWTTMGELKIGDRVVSAEGLPTKITGIYPQGEIDVWRLTFSDGTSVECCGDHLWHTTTEKDRSRRKRMGLRKEGKREPNPAEGCVKPTSEIIDTLYTKRGRMNHSIPMTKPVEFESPPLPLNPYIFGALLGDGCFRGSVPAFSSADSEIIDYFIENLPENIQITHRSSYNFTINSGGKTNSIKTLLIELGLWKKYSNEKFIPDVFKFANVQDRIQLLRGLMDTDGGVEKSGTGVSIGLSSKQLIDDIKELVQSLGGVATDHTPQQGFYYKGENKVMCKLNYRISIVMPSNINPFQLKRKASLVVPKTKYKPRRFIVAAQHIGKKVAQCITVDNERRLYITDHYIVTHNSYTSIYAALELLNQQKAGEIIYTRSLVQSSPNPIGILPGTVEEKLGPYIEPLHGKLEELLETNSMKAVMPHIRTMPINFMRGANFTDNVVLIDECFDGETPIMAEYGKNNIIKLESLFKYYQNNKKLPRLMTLCEETGKFQYDNITRVMCNGEREVVTVKASNRKIKCTEDHKFLTLDGWKEIGSLPVGTALVGMGDGHQMLKTPNEDQFQYILGSFLGDGSISFVRSSENLNRFRVRFRNGASQENYLRSKAEIFDRSDSVCIIEENGYSKKPAFQFQTKCLYMNREFPLNKHTIPDWMIDEIDPRALAVWFMDDGSVSKNPQGYINQISLWTCSFDEESHQKLKSLLMRFGIESTVSGYFSKAKNKYFRFIRLNRDNSQKFLTITAPYIHEDFRYKINDSQDIGNYEWNNAYGVDVSVLDSVTRTGETSLVYDIEMENNHNFLIGSKYTNNGLVVHNCQNTTFRELETIATRIGAHSRIWFIGDLNQSDLGGKHQNDFRNFCEIFSGTEHEEHGIFHHRFTSEDILRSEICRHIVETLETHKHGAFP